VGLKTNTLEVSAKLSKGSFFILIGHQAGGTRNLYTLPANVKSFSALFNVNQEVLDSYYRPKMISIAGIKLFPNKLAVLVKAKILRVM
jgi:hypothetical protein